MQDPAAFTLGFDGHRLSTSYAGFDSAEGLSMLEAVDVRPNQLEVDPSTRTYSLRAAHEQTMTFIPSPSAWDAVKVWRDINGLRPAGGVSKLAGRFVFDLWGGNYASSASALARAFRYGLTDAMVVWHNWQRWGYDYRLPEIFPPNPKLGSTEDFAAMAELCRKNGVLFAPHDNYIDFDPDAEGFSYDQIAFSPGGTPVKVWFNKGRDAQSYRWRADRVQAAVKSNLIPIRDRIAPTAYFIDVWSSAGPYDYWTRDGAFHDRLSTRKVWAGTFDWIRRTLGGNAPQISESGHDQLIGSLDGAQTNHLRVDTPPAGEMGWTVWNIKVSDAERIPWFDAAHHDRFILHSAGYENRYAGGLDTATHGIYSDDYITTEVLDGHPAMVPAPMGRDVVRKYWLLHDCMRALALGRFASHEFAAGDLHRQHVKWENGGEVWVNRGAGDWRVEGHTLPQYGFYARVPGPGGVTKAGAVTEAAIERRDGVIVEWSRSPASAYSNTRPYVTDRLPLSVSAGGVEDLGNRQFRLTLKWNVTGPVPDGYRILVHFTDAAGNILFQGDHNGPGPSAQWRGEFQTSAVVRVPDTVAAGERFEMRVGLYGSGGPRAVLAGNNDDGCRLRLARMEWTGAAVSAQPIAAPPISTPADPLAGRFNTAGRPIAFDLLTTAGELGKHVSAGTGFVSNIFLWTESGYFDSAAELKPLLHLWSLGIEEQFYLLWPPLLFLAWKRRWVGGLLFTLFSLSFAINIGQVKHDPVAAFYLPFSRMWELLIGCCLSYSLQLKNEGAPVSALARKLQGNASSAIGLTLVLWALLGLDRKTTFPGWAALLPTVGALLLISAGPDAWVNRHMLSNRAVVFVGLISYPLYLWHWPLLSFARITLSKQPPNGAVAVIVCVSVLLAWLTYRFVERPIRRAQTFRLPLGLVGAAVIVGCLGFYVNQTNGMVARFQTPPKVVVDQALAPSAPASVPENQEALDNGRQIVPVAASKTAPGNPAFPRAPAMPRQERWRNCQELSRSQPSCSRPQKQFTRISRANSYGSRTAIMPAPSVWQSFQLMPAGTTSVRFQIAIGSRQQLYSATATLMPCTWVWQNIILHLVRIWSIWGGGLLTFLGGQYGLSQSSLCRLRGIYGSTPGLCPDVSINSNGPSGGLWKCLHGWRSPPGY